MFTNNDHYYFSSPYFRVLEESPDYVELQSVGSESNWILMNIGKSLQILKKGSAEKEYGFFATCASVSLALRKIVNYDAYTLIWNPVRQGTDSF